MHVHKNTCNKYILHYSFSLNCVYSQFFLLEDLTGIVDSWLFDSITGFESITGFDSITGSASSI